MITSSDERFEKCAVNGLFPNFNLKKTSTILFLFLVVPLGRPLLHRITIIIGIHNDTIRNVSDQLTCICVLQIRITPTQSAWEMHVGSDFNSSSLVIKICGQRMQLDASLRLIRAGTHARDSLFCGGHNNKTICRKCTRLSPCRSHLIRLMWPLSVSASTDHYLESQQQMRFASSPASEEVQWMNV